METAPLTETQSSELAADYRSVRATTEALAAPLTPEDAQVQSMPDASPTKWHLGHTSWFFETFALVPSLPGYRPFHSDYGYLFNSYYETLGERQARPQRGVLSRPSLEEVRAYRRYVDDNMRELLGGVDAQLRARLELGLAHEEQHQELLLTDIQHAFSLNVLRPAYSTRTAVPAGEAPPLRWLVYEGGVYPVGADGTRGFAFDHEGPRHRVFVEPFQLGSRLVTQGEYLAFLEDGGYRRPELWLSDGWAAVQAERWSAPLYWEQREGAWWRFSLGGMRPLALDAPVCHVSYYEADAYARWANARLPTEAEWEVAAAGVPVEGNLLESGALRPLPAVADPDDEERPLQLFGDAWEWTQSAYAPYPGFRPSEGALGEYNGKFMCSQLVLRGGSCATPRRHLRASYRNFFPPLARWQFSGLRLARPLDS